MDELKNTLRKQADDWYERHGDNPVVFITDDGDHDLYWHAQQSVPDNAVWRYNGRTKSETGMQRDNLPEHLTGRLNTKIKVLVASDVDGNIVENFTGFVKDIYKNKVGEITVLYMKVGDITLNMNRSYHIQ